MNTEPRDERELQAALEVHTPGWLPGIKANLSFKRLWDKRQERFVRSVTDTSGATIEELQERVEEADGFTDLLLVAANRAGELGDSDYIDTLAHLVAAALMDRARIDTTSYLVTRLVKLDPVHIRVLASLAIESSDFLRISSLAARLEMHPGIVESCLSELVDVGFVGLEERDATVQPLERKQWYVTRLGAAAGKTIKEIHQDLSTKRRVAT